MSNQYFNGLIEEMSALEAVVAITLGGSRATGRADATSDYDVYIYANEEVPYDDRKRITDTYCRYMELGNTYYELEDDGQLKDGVVIEMIYRKVDDFEQALKVHMVDHIAYGGYTTCFLSNLQEGLILYDPQGIIGRLKDKYQGYPKELRQNILIKNRELLSGKIPSLDDQILKAVKREDLPSVNHRIAEFLASYFDIIFALNYVTHPGEKRMLDIATESCDLLPPNMVSDVQALVRCVGRERAYVKQILQSLIEEVDVLIKLEN